MTMPDPSTDQRSADARETDVIPAERGGMVDLPTHPGAWWHKRGLWIVYETADSSLYGRPVNLDTGAIYTPVISGELPRGGWRPAVEEWEAAIKTAREYRELCDAEYRRAEAAEARVAALETKLEEALEAKWDAEARLAAYEPRQVD